MRCQTFTLMMFLLVHAGAQAGEPEAFAGLERRAADLGSAGSSGGSLASPNRTAFTDYSPAKFAANIEAHRALLRDLAAVDRSILSHDSQVTYDVISWDSRRIVDREPYPLLQFPYTPYEFMFRGPNPVVTGFNFVTEGDARAYVELLGRYPAALASIERLLDAQEAQGIYVQRDVAAKIQRQMASYAKAGSGSFAWPSDERLALLPSQSRLALRKSIETAIDTSINPALLRFSERFGDAYQAKAPTRYGLAQYPGGRDYYKVLIRYRLGIEKSPEELFASSQAALDAIEVELKALRAEMGDVGSRQDFERRLAADPRFTAKTPADVERVYLDYMRRIDPFMSKLFCHPAPYGYGVQRAAPDEEAALTFGFADTETKPIRRGMYYYNGSNLDQRSLLPAQALIYHELAPGHYWQEAMASIAVSTGPYPRRSNAFAESWGDYAQLLAYEQGVFRSPSERYGRKLFNAMFHARALADIGINYFGYDFDWGLQVLARYTVESERQNRSSLARDTTDWQAQILPYSFGSHALLRLREKARFELGNRFSEPRFYDALLSQGAIALPVLEKHLEWFIEQEKTGAAPGICTDAPSASESIP